MFYATNSPSRRVAACDRVHGPAGWAGTEDDERSRASSNSGSLVHVASMAGAQFCCVVRRGWQAAGHGGAAAAHGSGCVHLLCACVVLCDACAHEPACVCACVRQTKTRQKPTGDRQKKRNKETRQAAQKRGTTLRQRERWVGPQRDAESERMRVRE